MRVPAADQSNPAPSNTKEVSLKVNLLYPKGDLRARENCKEDAKMNKPERIQRYIARTRIPRGTKHRYDITMGDLNEITQNGQIRDVFQLVVVAYEFGMAKGWRAAKREGTR